MSDSWDTVSTITILLSLIKTTVLFFIILYLFYFTLHLLFLLSIPLLLISIINSINYQLLSLISHLLTKLLIPIFPIFSIHCFIPILYYFFMLCDTFQIDLYLYLKSLFLYYCFNFIFPTFFS